VLQSFKVLLGPSNPNPAQIGLQRRLSSGAGPKTAARSPLLSAQERFDRLNQTFNIDRELEFGVLHVPGHARERLLGLGLEQHHVLEPEHREEMGRPRVVLALGDDLDHLGSRFAEHRIGHRRPEFANDRVGLREQQNLLVELEFFRLDSDETQGLQRLDHRRPIGEVAAVGEAAADQHALGRARRRRLHSHILQNPPEGLAMLGMSVLAADAAEPVADDRMFEKDGPRPDLADEA
jgi:hypothetical protein